MSAEHLTVDVHEALGAFCPELDRALGWRWLERDQHGADITWLTME